LAYHNTFPPDCNGMSGLACLTAGFLTGFSGISATNNNKIRYIKPSGYIHLAIRQFDCMVPSTHNAGFSAVAASTAQDIIKCGFCLLY